MNKPIESIEPEQEQPIVPETTLDLKACAIVEHLKEAVKPNEFGEFVLSTKGILSFLKTEITEDLRIKEIRNPRQLKKDIIERAVQLFPSIVCIKTGKSGNKIKSLALKPSANRKDFQRYRRLLRN